VTSAINGSHNRRGVVLNNENYPKQASSFWLFSAVFGSIFRNKKT